jgi:ketosteroid isomerase-like protein
VCTRSLLAVLILVLGASSACRKTGDASGTISHDSPAGLTDSDFAGIRAADSAFAASANAGKVDGVLAVYTANAALLPPNSPPQKGHSAIRSFWGSFLDAYTVQFELESDTIEGRGDLAYNMGHYRFTAVPKAKANPGVADEGKFLEVLKRQPDGTWKYAVDMYSSNLTPQH